MIVEGILFAVFTIVCPFLLLSWSIISLIPMALEILEVPPVLPWDILLFFSMILIPGMYV